MKISSEWDLIEKITGLIKTSGIPFTDDVAVPPGDDCFSFKISDDRYGLITADMSVEDTHFRKTWSTPEQIGFKAMSGNISDICSMGGMPKFAFVSIGIPESADEEYILSIYKGMLEAANFSGSALSGGDSVKSDKLIISITLYGECTIPPVKRSGAETGNFIYVTGDIGSSAAGLHLLKYGNKVSIEKYNDLIMKHLKPGIKSSAVESIINEFSPASMIDISDGILSDLRHICRSSGKGFELYREKLPFNRSLESFCTEYGTDILKTMLQSGEEYELLFTSAKDIPYIELNKIHVTQIGKIIEENFYLTDNGRKDKIDISGYDHFS